MENKIYPLNVGEHDPYPLKLKPKKHKPTFKEWIKERKAMVIGVAVIAVLTTGVLLVDKTGLLKGLLLQGGSIENIYDVNLELNKKIADTTTPGIKDITPINKVVKTFSILSNLIDPTHSKASIKYELTQQTIQQMKIVISQQGSGKEVASHILSDISGEWEWDGKNTITTDAGFNKYVEDGKYEARLKYGNTVYPEKISAENDSHLITVNLISAISPLNTLKLSLTSSLSSPQAIGTEINFDLTLTKETTPKSYSCTINFGDGSTVEKKQCYGNGNKVSFTHKYATKGSFTVKAVAYKEVASQKLLEGRDRNQIDLVEVGSTEIQYEIKEATAPLSVAITTSPESPVALGADGKVKVTFTFKAAGGTGGYDYKLNFGEDASTYTEKLGEKDTLTVDHEYTSAKTYKVTVEATGIVNGSKTTAKAEKNYEVKAAAAVVAAPKQCSDGLDNDGNGLKDYPADPGCDSAVDDTENSAPPPPPTTTTTTTTSTNDTKKEICDNNKDDDGDKKIDYEDDDCKAPEGAKIEISKVGVSSAKFNPEIKAVKVYYTISKDAHVVVDILDSKGSVVATLLDEDQEGPTSKLPGKGDHSVFWEGTKDNKAGGEKVTDGTYTYKITANPKKYPTLKTSKEGTITVDSKYVAQGDFEDINNGGTGVGTGTGTQGGTGTTQGATGSQIGTTGSQTGAAVLGTLTTPVTAIQMVATQTLQNTTTGKTSGTGPEMWIYLISPFLSTFAFAYKKIRKN